MFFGTTADVRSWQILLQKSKIEEARKSREDRFLDAPAAASPPLPRDVIPTPNPTLYNMNSSTERGARMSADLSRLLKELQDFGVPEQRSCEIAAELIRVGARTVFAQLGEIAGKNEATPWEIALLAAAFIGEGNGGRYSQAVLPK